MTQRLNKVKESLRQTHDFAAGLLIGSVAVTPVFAAATETAMDNVSMPILVGSIVLLLVALLLKATRKKRAAPPEPVAANECEGIGRYRLQLGRGGVG